MSKDSLHVGDHVVMSEYGVESLARHNPATAAIVRQHNGHGIVTEFTEEVLVLQFGPHKLSIRGSYLRELDRVLQKLVDPPLAAESPLAPLPSPPPPAAPDAASQAAPDSNSVAGLHGCQWAISQFLLYKGNSGARSGAPPLAGDLYQDEPRALDEQERLLYHTALRKFRRWLDPTGEFELGERNPHHGRLPSSE